MRCLSTEASNFTFFFLMEEDEKEAGGHTLVSSSIDDG